MESASLWGEAQRQASRSSREDVRAQREEIQEQVKEDRTYSATSPQNKRKEAIK